VPSVHIGYTLVSVLEIAVPHVRPVRAVVDAFETLIGSALLVAGGLVIGRLRS